MKKEWMKALGPAAWTAVLLLGCFELALHSDAVLQRYRAVFAVGRATDKILFVERHRPPVLVLGNSRADNGIVPALLISPSSTEPDGQAFNLGMPGANALVLSGVAHRLLEHGVRPADVFVTLDETVFQNEDSLGYYGFLGKRDELLSEGFHAAYLGSLLRTWYYSGNLRQLREPDKLIRFAQATVGEVEAVGGSAASTHGYRAGFKGRFQNREQLMAQEAGTRAPPDPRMVTAMQSLVRTLVASGARVHLIATPLFGRDSAFGPAAAPGPYAEIARALETLGARWLPVPATALTANHFADPGHLNDSGARLYSAALGQAWRGETER